jgi:hypothetical protein
LLILTIYKGNEITDFCFSKEGIWLGKNNDGVSLLSRESGLRVSEAAYQTGFSDPNYFTICFKKEFGENPSQIVATLKDSADTIHIDTTKQD